MPTGTLPSYRDPPVIETVIGVEFAPIEGWSVPHFGLFWNQVKDRFGSFEVHSPIASRIEVMDGPGQFPEQRIQLEMMTTPEVRCWFVNGDGSELIQVQHDRLIFNWRKRDGAYPRYSDSVRPSFVSAWGEFKGFLHSQGLQPPRILQCEITYVSHIPKGDGWEDVSEWSKVLKSIAPPPNGGILAEPESCNISASYLLPKRQGRLRIDAKLALRKSDAKEILALNITSRGRPDSSELGDVLKWFDLGHEWVVQGFTEATTTTMHDLWGREQ